MLNKNYINVIISVMEEDLEVFYGIITDYDFIGIEEKLDEVILSFEDGKWNEELKNKLEQAFIEYLPSAKITNIDVFAEQNWNEEWEKNVQPVVISKDIVITPEWKKDEFDCKYKIIINPKMSFGTGQHSTTMLMAKMLEKHLTENKNAISTMIDAGTGTGVLAIEAAMLGVNKIYAFDNDDWSFENAVENVKLNNVSEFVKVTQENINDYNFPEADCITANMFLNLIKSAFPKFYKSIHKREGILLVSGILVFDREDLLQSADENNFQLIEETQDQEWCCFKFKTK